MEPPVMLTADVDLIVVHAPQDGELAAFVVRRVRGVAQKMPILIALDGGQLSRLSPDWGHDDFVLLPTNPHELLARLRAIEWKYSDFSQPSRIKTGELVIDIEAHVVQCAGRSVALTHREFELLVELVTYRGAVVRRASILSKIWAVRGAAADRAGRSLDVHIRRLRAKLQGTVSIETVRSVGFRLVVS